MTHEKLLLSLAALTLAGAAWDAHADHGYRRSLPPQHRHYDHGYRHEHLYDHHRAGADCDRYSESRSQSACAYGRSFGHAMAQSLGAPTGQHDGFLLGYGRARTAGLADGAGNIADASEGRRSVNAPGGFIQGLIEDRLAELRSRAAEEGRERGRADAVRRFEAILDGGRPLDDRFDESALITGYEGEWGVAERWLPRPGDREVLEGDLGYRQRVRVVDRHTDHHFQQAIRQLDVALAYSVWELDGAAEWADDDGPTMSADEAWRLFYHTDARDESPWARLAIDHPQSWYPPEGLPGNPDLPAIFQQAFRQEYDARSPTFYRQYFDRGWDRGSNFGYGVGYHLGRQATYYQAQAEELDRVYQRRSKAAWDAAWAGGTGDSGGYRNGFHDTVEHYRTHPVVGLAIAGVESLEEVDDGIISPGETVGLAFSLTNLGLVAAPWEARIGGRVDGAEPAVRGEIPGSARRRFRSAGATVASTVAPREVAALALDVEVGGERLSAAVDQVVRNVVELAGMEVELDLVDGSATVTARIENPSDLESPASVFLALTVAGEAAQAVELGTLAGAAAETAGFRLSDLDPLELIGRRQELRLELTMGPQPMETAAGSIGEPDATRGLADYFDALNGGPVAGHVPAGIDPDQRRQAVADRILELARAEIAEFGHRGGENVWKPTGGADRHIVGALARKRLEGTHGAFGDAGYRALGQRLQALAPAIQGSWKRRAFKKRALEIERDRKR